MLLAGFDDIPEHAFLVEEVFEDLITGTALTGPLSGEYGEPDIARWFCGCSQHQPNHRTKQSRPKQSASGKGLVPDASLFCITKPNPHPTSGAIAPERRRHVATDQIRLQEAQHLDLPQNLPQGTAAHLGQCPQAIPQDQRMPPKPRLRVAELNQTFTTLIKEAQAYAAATSLTVTPPDTPTAAQAPRLGVTRPRYQRVRLVGDGLVAELAQAYLAEASERLRPGSYKSVRFALGVALLAFGERAGRSADPSTRSKRYSATSPSSLPTCASTGRGRRQA